MKIFITGGLGFIGIALANKLVRLGHKILLLDSLTPQIHGDIPRVVVPEGAEVIRLDIRQLAERYQIIDGHDVIFHLAAETGTGQSMYRITDYVSANEVGTATLLEAIAKCTRRPRKIILASSRSVYGEGAYISSTNPTKTIQPAPRSRAQLKAGVWEPLDDQGVTLTAIPTPESLPFAPSSVYAATKASQELLISSAADALGLHSTIFRFQNVYGEGQSLLNPYTGIISIFFNRARQGMEIPIYEDGMESRDFVHISDIVTALATSLDAEIAPNFVMNLGSGIPTSVMKLSTELLIASGFDVPVRVTSQFRLGDIRHCYADLARAKQTIGYEPRISLNEGLQRFCFWAAKQPLHEDKLDKATEELQAKGLAN